MKLIVDVPSVVKRCLFVGVDSENGRKVPFNGKEVQVNSRHYGYDNAINSITSVMDKLGLKPSDAILVLEQGRTKMRRQAIFAGYKVKPEGAPEIGVEVSAAVEMFVKAMGAAGAAVACQPEVEADDVIAYFCEKLAGPKVVFSEDGDLAQLINADTMLWRQGGLVSDNPFGPFATRHIRLYKALVGDSSDCYKGAAGFGEKAWLDLLANYNEPDLDALEIMIQKGLLHELREDAAFFKPFNKVVDGAAHVYQSYALAKLRPEWVNTVDAPLELRQIERAPATDYRLKKFDRSETRAEAFEAARLAAQAHLDVQVEASRRQKVVFDIEILGSEKPVFLVCTVNRDTGEKNAYWMHRAGDMEKLLAELRRTDLTWISFNGNTFDAPLVYAATQGHDAHVIKRMADMIINGGMKPWELTEEINFEMTYFDHIDISEVAPGVRISLKTYAGRMGYPTMQDMPVHHDTDLTEDQLPMVEGYCFNDCGVTLALFDTIESDIELREEMGKEYGLDLRSKSDAQVAEAVLRKVLGIRGRIERHVPKTVRYTAPSFIRTDNPVILRIIGELQNCEFEINRANGQVVAPDFLKDPVKLGYGWYQMGVGGLHSTHDVKLYKVAGSGRRISDFDVASYYPNIMMSAGLIPSFDGDEEMGRRFLDEYRKIYVKRVDAKRRSQQIDAEIAEIQAIIKHAESQ